MVNEPLRPLQGLVMAVDKPLGWTTFDVVKRLRGILLARLRPLGIKKLKVGHAGTLDPLATGVVLVCTGRATAAVDTLQAGVKEYEASVRLGATTPSFDMETPVDNTYPTAHITRELVQQTLPRFIGTIRQVPPAYSACKIQGLRAYEMARDGQQPPLRAKELVISDIQLLQFAPQEIQLRITCSKGTYIRALARDLGEALGTGAHLAALRRTRVGAWCLGGHVTSMAQAEETLRRNPMQVQLADEKGRPLPPQSVPPLPARPDDAKAARPDDPRNILPFGSRADYHDN